MKSVTSAKFWTGQRLSETAWLWRSWPFLLTLALALGFPPCKLLGQTVDPLVDSAEFRPDRIIIRPKQNPRKSLVPLFPGLRLHRAYPDLDLQVIELPPGVQVLDAIERFRASGAVDYAEPDYIVRGGALPTDPNFVNQMQWGFHNTGQNGGLNDADIDAPEGWEVRTSASGIVVAVIDTGVRYTHEDLAPNMWRNPNEIPNNGIDDDGNTFIDDVHGMDSIKNSGFPLDDNGHGTHVAGTIGAIGNNGRGGVGVAWQIQIMACKFLDAANRGSVSDAIECVNYARANGAQIINGSWTIARHSSALQTAINTARNLGIIFVAASGNDKLDLDVTPVYPASYELDNIVVVTGLTRNNELDIAYANYGMRSVDIAAPGTSIYSTWHSSDTAYRFMSGTSMAAPFVTGTLALMKAQFPDYNYRQLIDRLYATADSVENLAGKTATGASVNLRKALGSTSTASDGPPKPPPPPSPPKPGSVTLLSRPGSATLIVQVRGEPGRTYVLQSSKNLSSWNSVSTNSLPNSGALMLTNTAPAILGTQFYRTVAVE